MLMESSCNVSFTLNAPDFAAIFHMVSATVKSMDASPSASPDEGYIMDVEIIVAPAVMLAIFIFRIILF